MRIASISRPVLSLVLATSAAILCLPASAGPIVYTSQAAFLAAVSNPGTDTFDNFDNTTITPSPIFRTAGSFGYRASVTVNTDGFFGAGSGSDHWLSTNVATDAITFDTFTGGVVAGVGGFFFGSDVNGAFVATSSVTIVATDSSGSTSSTLINASTTTFLGFLSSTGAITSLSVTATQPSPTTHLWPTVNNLILAQANANVVTVPEPGAAALLGIGLIAAWLGRRRSRC